MHFKDRHYWTQLRAALTAGAWSAPTPAKARNGRAVSWSDLLRKFNKHCTGFGDVAEIASQTQALSIWLSAGTRDDDELGAEPDDELCLAAECMLLPERVQEAAQGLDALGRLKTTRSDSLAFALAYYAYALGRPAQCLDYLTTVPAICDAQSHVPASLRSDSSTLHPPSAATETSTSWTGSLLSLESAPTTTTNIADGRAWAMAESVRSMCLQGMSHEKLHPDNPELAIQAYAAAIPLLNVAEGEIPRSLHTNASLSPFSQYRELWRWIERLMFRAISLLARTRHLDDEQGLVWSLFTHYSSCSTYWPPSFRASHRSIVAVLHIRALIIVSGSPSSPSLQPLHWSNTARSIITEYRTILDKSTRFPKAGQRNTKVEDLVDLSVAVWEASGAIADRAQWVIDVLWWATRLTFNSYRIFRHMARLLYVSGDPELAKRTLRLYVEIVTKTRAAGVDVDSDTNSYWVETLVDGARMLCRLALSRQGSGGVEEAKEAGDLLEKAKTRTDEVGDQLVARIALAEGVWNIVTAIIEKDARTRPTRLRHALEQFSRSVQICPTPTAHHQLAIALALPGPLQNIEDAVTSARAAVEAAPSEIRHWHLLGLLLTAQGEWEKAQEVLDIGAAINESPPEIDESRSASDISPEKSEATTPSESVISRDFETVRARDGTPPRVHEMILDADATAIPPSSTLLHCMPDHPPATPQDAFEYALQVRLTQMALTEHVLGPEGAETKWVDVFGWIAERKGTAPGTPLRSSIDTGSRSAVTQPTSMVLASEVQTIQSTLEVRIDIPCPPPITVTPATPADPDYKFRFSPPPGDRDTSRGKRVQQMLKNRVHKGQEKISTISRKIGNGVVRSGSFKRTNSAPDFHAALQNQHYQASSIHSRKPLRSLRRRNSAEVTDNSADDRPVPPPPPTSTIQDTKPIPQASREDKLLSELWASCAATFRRLGKIDQAKGALQEAEIKNQENAAVWVQLGLYHHALNHNSQAIESFQKALFMSPDDVSANLHMCTIYLTPRSPTCSESHAEPDVDSDKVDLAAGLLGYMSCGPGWDVPEVWYFLAKAYGLRGQKDKQRECLTTALALCENRCIRDVGKAVGWCL